MKTEFKNWLITTKKSNAALTNAILANVLNRTTKEVESFIYTKDRFPSFEDIFRLYHFAVDAKLILPTEISTFFYSTKTRSKALAGKYFPVSEMVVAPHGRARHFLVNGELKTISQITTDRKKRVVLNRHIYTKNILPGDDVTALVNDYILSNKIANGKLYSFRGKLMTLAVLSKESGFSEPYLSRRLKSIDEGSVVDDILISIKKHRKFVFHGEVCTQSAISEKTGTDKAIVCKKLKNAANGADVTDLFKF